MQMEESQRIVSCDEAACLDARRVMVEGFRGEGRTEAAIQRAAKLMGEGVEPDAVLVVTATDEAASVFSERLAAVCPRGAEIRIRSSFSLASSLVCGADCSSGDAVSVATAAQEAFLCADALTSLQEALGDSDAKVPAKTAVARTSELALESGLVLAGEVYGRALQVCKEGCAPAWARGIRYAIADDWGLLDADARRLCEVLGARQCFAAGKADAVFASDGGCVRVRLAARKDGSLRIRTFARCVDEADSRPHDAALHEHTIAPDDESVRIVKWRTAQDELEGVAPLVKSILARHADFTPSDVCIVVPNAVWAKAVRRSLHSHMLESTESLESNPLAADPRKDATKGALAAYVRLNMLAHPESSLSWRMWVGIGRKGLAARPWLGFMRWAEGEGLDFASAKDRLCSQSGEPFACAEALRTSLAEAGRFIREASDLRGFSLLSCVCPDGDDAFIRMASGMDEREDAVRLCRRVSDNARFQHLDAASSRIRICSASHMAGMDFGAVVIMGAVDGLVPEGCCPDGSSQADALIERECGLFCDAAAKAREELVVSLFQKAPMQVAQSFHMRIMRKKMEGGVQLAMLRPSPFIGRAGDAAPGAESAEQLIARR